MARKLGITGLVGMLCLCFASPGFAQLRKDVGIVQGKVLSVDSEKKMIKVKDYHSEQVQTFTVDASFLPGLRENQEVMVFFKKGAMQAKNVKIISQKSSQAGDPLPAPVAVPEKTGKASH